MIRTQRAPLVGALALAALVAGCPPPAEIPPSLDSGFSMAVHSLDFPNFASGYPASVMDADLMVRMFGAEGVCLGDDASPCILTPSARHWMQTANANMNGGRCEGFAVLASLMFAKHVEAAPLGGKDARSLAIWENVALQRELAYWFSTQLVQGVVGGKTKAFLAKDVMPFLVEALSPTGKERWRLGIVRKIGNAVVGGHSLTPIGYFTEAPGVYQLRVYDNNDPDHERLLRIDTVANRWEFDAAVNPLDPALPYVGDATNRNPLYFAPITTRLGKLPCDFCGRTSDVQVTTVGGVQAQITGADGQPIAGVRDGEIAAGSGVVSPAFAGVPNLVPPSWIITAKVEGDYLVSLAPSGADPVTEARAPGGVVAFGQGYVAAAEGLSLSGKTNDTLGIAQQGATVAYMNNSGSSVTLATAVAMANDPNVLEEVKVTFHVTSEPDTGASNGITIDRATGVVNVVANGFAGGDIVVNVTQTDKTTGHVTAAQLEYPVTGPVSQLTADTAFLPVTGVLYASVDNGDGQQIPITSTCIGTGPGCGGTCTVACAVDEGCQSGGDCLSGACHAQSLRCVVDACIDGAFNGDETDLDCGGSCLPCALDATCKVDHDCRAGACRDGRCVAAWTVSANVTGLPAGAQLVLRNNGGDDLAIERDGVQAFATRVADIYAVTIAQQPGIATCTVNAGSGVATADVTVAVACTPLYDIGGTVTGLPEGTTLRLLNNGGDTLEITTDGPFHFATLVPGTYAVTTAGQPAGAWCTVTNGSGTATSDVTQIAVACTPANCGPVDGLVGCWSFNGNANEDGTGGATNVVITGATPAADRTGTAARAYAFDGLSQITMSAPKLPLGRSARTVAFWFSTTKSVPGYANFLSWGTFAANQRYSMATHGDRLYVAGQNNDVGASGAAINDGAWHHALVTFDGANGAEFFVDGVRTSTARFAGTLNTVGTNLVFGANVTGGGSERYTGLLDDVRIWNRVVTASEAAQLFAAGPQ